MRAIILGVSLTPPERTSPERLVAALAAGARVCVLDVRDDELAERVPFRDAPWVLEVPFERLSGDARRRLETDDRVVVLCSDGSLAENAAEMMRRMGFWRTTALAGGLVSWRERVNSGDRGDPAC